MKLYAELRQVRGRQIMADAAVTAAALLFVVSGVLVYRLVAVVAALGEAVEDVGGAVDRIPGLGGVATALIESGRTQQEIVLGLAWVFGFTVAGVGVAAVLLGYLPRRLAWVREATTAVRLRDDRAALQVLAYRAITRRSLSRLTAAVADPGAALQKGDYLPLASIELQELGLRPPA